MRIVLGCEFFYPDNGGSTPTNVSNLVRYLKDHHPEHEIDVITSRNFYRGEAGELPRRGDWGGVQITRLQTPKSKRPGLVVRALIGAWFTLTLLLELLRRPRYDLLLVVTNPPAIALAGRWYWRLRRVPFIYLINDLYPDVPVVMGVLPETHWLTRWTAGLQKGWLAAAARVVVVGRCMRQRLIDRYGVAPEKVRVIPDYVDPTTIQPLPKAESVFRRQHELSGFIVLYAGNFAAYIDFDLLLQTAARLRRTHPEITFVFVGDGLQRDSLIGQVAQEGHTNVRVLPPVPQHEMNAVLAACDVALVPLDAKMVGIGVPSKTYFTMCAARPVIAIMPSHGEIALSLAETQAGLLCPPGDVAALEEAILTLAADPALTARMGEQAREAAEHRYTLPCVAAQFAALIGEVGQEAGIPCPPPAPAIDAHP
jgi:glycosyltransferase involved in cell wall biosynthesis